MTPGNVTRLLSVAMLLLVAGMASGQQNFPNKTIRIVASSGGNDVPARLIAQGLNSSLGWPVIVENRPSGPIPGQVVSQASPDGYTLLIAGLALWIGPLLQKTSYDPVRDFSPITLTTTQAIVLVVHGSLPVNSVKELIALAKAKPGELNNSATLPGSSPYLAAELFKAMAGVNIVYVPYKGSATQMLDLMEARVQLAFLTASLLGPLVPHLKSGKLKALAVTSSQPSAMFPGLPTVAAAGVPGYHLATTVGMFAPAKTPATLISRLNREVVQLLHQPDVKQKFFNAGSEVVGSTPEELAAAVKSDMTRLGKLIKDVGIKAE